MQVTRFWNNQSYHRSPTWPVVRVQVTWLGLEVNYWFGMADWLVLRLVILKELLSSRKIFGLWPYRDALPLKIIRSGGCCYRTGWLSPGIQRVTKHAGWLENHNYQRILYGTNPSWPTAEHRSSHTRRKQRTDIGLYGKFCMKVASAR